MAMISWPFDSTVTMDGNGNPIYSRTYSSDVLANILRKYFRDGVFTADEESFQVVEHSGMDIHVNPGHCLMLGRHGYNELATTLTVSNADTVLDRIDLVVLRLDLSVSALSIELFMVDGTPAATPAAPALTRNSTVYELALAEVYVAAGATEIQQSSITDTRLDSDRCGVVASIIGDTDTSTYYAQIAADLAEFKAGREADFDAWFASLTAIFDASAMETIQSLINAKADASVELTGTLASGSWSGTSAPYTQAVTMTGLEASDHAIISLQSSATRTQFNAAASAQLRATAQSANSVTITAEGEKPTVDLPIQLLIVG